VLVWLQLDVGQPRVVVDDAVQEVETDAAVELARHPLSAGLAVAGDREPRQLLDVDVQQRTRTRPLVAAERLALAARPARETIAVQHLPDRRSRPANDSRQAARPEVRLAPRAHDRVFLRRRQPARLAMRATRTIDPPARRSSVGQSNALAPMPPAMRRRRRDVEGGRGRPQRQPLIDKLDERDSPSRSELGPRVSLHPGPPSRW
jgi:hypothetical protein